MIAQLLVAIFCFAELSIAIETDRLKYVCGVDGGIDFAELILNEQLTCIKPSIANDQYICGVTKNKVEATGHIKFGNNYKGVEKDAIIFRVEADRSYLSQQKCYSCDVDQHDEQDTNVCKGDYNPLSYGLNAPSTCSGPGIVFEAGKDYYFNTQLPSDFLAKMDYLRFNINGKMPGSTIDCKLELELGVLNKQ